MLICCFIYNYLKTKTPAYLLNVFIVRESITRAGTDTITLMVKKVQLSRDEHQFAHCACKLWNGLPNMIRNSRTRDIFSNEIKSFFINLQQNNNTLKNQI